MRLLIPLIAFFQWWFSTLLSVLPARYRLRDDKAMLSLSKNELSLENTGTRCVIGDRDGVLKFLEKVVDAGYNNLSLTVSDDYCFSTEFVIPLAALDDVDNIIRYEFDKLTPFDCDAVFYSHSVQAIDKEGQQTTICLLAVKKVIFQALLDEAKRQGLAVVGLHAKGRDQINLLPREQQNRTKPRLALLVYMLAVAVLSVAMVLPLWQKHVLTDQLSKQQQQLGKVLKLESKAFHAAQAQTQQLDNLWAFKQASVNNISLLNELSIQLPSDTFLHRLQRKANKLSLNGESASASQLIEVLEASRYLSSVRFSSAVTQQPNSTLERFAITAVIGDEAL